ncbi:MAG TPA: hypothetical protein VIN77_06010 [Aurantimonas sp.]
MTILESRKPAQTSATIRVGALAIGIIAATMAIVFDQIVLERDLLEKSVPDLSPAGLAKSALCLLSAGFFLYAVKPDATDRRSAADRYLATPIVTLSLLSQSIMILSVLSIFAMPTALNFMVNSEASPMGLLSEGLLAAAVVALAASGLRLRKRKLGGIGAVPGLLVALVMTAVVFLILMEEISWGQHLFGWGTPEAFSDNIQSETNLHNFYTNRFEAAYYLAAIAAFVVVPFAWPTAPFAPLEPLRFYVPPREFILVSAPVSGYLYLSWNIVPLQIGFFVGVLTVLALLLPRVGRVMPRHIPLLPGLAAVIVFAQIVYLTMGDRLIHVHEVDELREFQISLLILVYAVWLLERASAKKVGVDAQ